jgi:hypothetical protein
MAAGEAVEVEEARATMGWSRRKAGQVEAAMGQDVGEKKMERPQEGLFFDQRASQGSEPYVPRHQNYRGD